MIALTDFKSGKPIVVNPAFICTMQSISEAPVDERSGMPLLGESRPPKTGSILTFVMTQGVAKVTESLDQITNKITVVP